MLPILFRIPLPQTPLMVWWALAALAALAFAYAARAHKRGENSDRNNAAMVAAGALALAYFLRGLFVTATGLPIYSYGVALGLSLVTGWYLVLGLSKRDKLVVDSMANAYVISAIVGLICSRLLYVVTNWSEFHSLADVVALRRGGLVAYGGFLGAFLGSSVYLWRERLKILPWLDVGAPALAAGLMLSRIGCYLFGCDYGKRLSDGAPGWLKSMGTFPHWSGALAEAGDGSAAFVRHRELYLGTPLGAELMKRNASFPVHPTQLYEALFGAMLLALMFWLRPRRTFKGQAFFVLAVAYGIARFFLEFVRDDPERGMLGPLSTSQWLGMLTAIVCGVLYVLKRHQAAQRRTAKELRRAAKSDEAATQDAAESTAEPPDNNDKAASNGAAIDS